MFPTIFSVSGASGDRFSDDIFVILLDDVSLTATPASEANSAESSGRRIDGLDTATQVVPVGRIGSNNGDIRFNWVPRHGDTEGVLFGNAAPTIIRVEGDANNYIELLWSAADTMRITYNANGAGAQTANWATGGSFFTPGTTYQIRIRWSGAGMRLYVDNVLRATIVAATGFIWPVPTTLYWGTDEAGISQVDAVFASI